MQNSKENICLITGYGDRGIEMTHNEEYHIRSPLCLSFFFR
jgi:hypothetical protein